MYNRTFSNNRHYAGGEFTANGNNMDKVIAAMRGRNPDKPSERIRGGITVQRLEINSQGICNTITSVQKDNLVIE